jgi:hypothetical protein
MMNIYTFVHVYIYDQMKYEVKLASLVALSRGNMMGYTYIKSFFFIEQNFMCGSTDRIRVDPCQVSLQP